MENNMYGQTWCVDCGTTELFSVDRCEVCLAEQLENSFFYSPLHQEHHTPKTEVTAILTTTTDNSKEIILTALRYLASCCDGARSLDGQGYNGVDASFGHDLAAKETLTPCQAQTALKMLKKYKKQLDKAGIELPKEFSIAKKHGQLIVADERVYIMWDHFPSVDERKYIKSFRYWKFDVTSKIWSVPQENLVDIADNPIFRSYEICHQTNVAA